MAQVPERAAVVVVGAGLAGLATACALTRRGVSDVVILEQEERPGSHASGRNAGLGRHVVTSAEIMPLVVEGMRFLRAPHERFPAGSYVRVTGSLVLAEGPLAATYRDMVVSLRAHGLAADWLERPDIENIVPWTAGSTFDGGVYCRQDGVIDVAALLDAYLRAAEDGGARLITSCRTLAIGVSDRTVTHVDTDGGRIVTPLLINAAGGWASEIARLAGAAALPLRSYRCHIGVTGPLSGVSPDWPFVCDASHELDYRPEPPGLLLSPGDWSAQAPGSTEVDPAMIENMRQKAARLLPALADVAIERAWVGLRTITPDGNFVIGVDPRVRGFIWCAGLGDHGVAASAAIGRLAAQAALGEQVPAAHAPARFEKAASSREAGA